MAVKWAIAVTLAKKYGKYAIYILPLVAVAVFWAVSRLARKPRVAAASAAKTDAVADAVRTIANKMSAANQQAAVEIAVARTRDNSVKERLQETLAVPDENERLRRLIALRKEVARQ